LPHGRGEGDGLLSSRVDFRKLEIRRTIEDDRFPHAPRLDPLRAALGKLEAAVEPTPQPKAPPTKAEKRARR
jgi:hypothetical protein